MAAGRDSSEPSSATLPTPRRSLQYDHPNFLGPKRVVGRLPDVMERENDEHFIHILDTATEWTEPSPDDFDEYFSLSVEG